MKRRGQSYQFNRSFPGYYGDALLGKLVRLLVNAAAIVDPKVVAVFLLHRKRRAQMNRVPNLTAWYVAIV